MRTSAEFEQGHIPGAFNIPLFTNEERAQVGTVYKKEGKDIAVKLGLKLVGPKLYHFIEEAEKIAPAKEIAVHCWRGGMRSGSFAWLLSTAGFKVYTLKKGYKNYRNFVLDSFAKDFNLVVLGGMTGSGKSEILRKMPALGIQIIDLELLASHKGSAFGENGMQPSTEQFENELSNVLLSLDFSKPILVEDESHSIGKVFINEIFWQKMRNCILLKLNIPFENRLLRIVDEYGKCDTSYLIYSLNKIQKRLGGENHRIALEGIQNNDLTTAARIILLYYDKGYAHGNSKRDPEKTILITPDSLEQQYIAETIANTIRKLI